MTRSLSMCRRLRTGRRYAGKPNGPHNSSIRSDPSEGAATRCSNICVDTIMEHGIALDELANPAIKRPVGPESGRRDPRIRDQVIALIGVLADGARDRRTAEAVP